MRRKRKKNLAHKKHKITDMRKIWKKNIDGKEA